MLPRTYEDQNCSIARALEVLATAGRSSSCARRSCACAASTTSSANLGVARNVLTDRLGRLVDEGILVRVPYQERPARFEYRLTEKGLDLWPVMMALLQWGDVHYPPEAGRPRVVRHRDCGGEVTRHLTCEKCGAELGPRDVVAEPGPGALAAA
jgi:hypothetical protein